MRPPGRIRRGSLRLRITAAFVLTGVVLSGVLSAATFVSVRRFLEDQRVRVATDELIVVLQLARDHFEAEGAEPDGLVGQLQLRGTYETLITAPADFFPSTISLTPRSIPTGLRTLVEDERIGYQFTHNQDGGRLVIGGPLPPDQTDAFLFFDLRELDETMSILLRVLFVSGVVVVAIAALAAQGVARRILRPVAEVSSAAQRVAEGLLETRVPSATRDEVGLLAASFNEMAAAFQDMLERERRFVANVSHELRTPLATLHSAGEMLVRHADELAPSTREAVHLVAEDVANLRRLVEELMEVSEVDAGRATLRWEEVDVTAVARAVVAKGRRDADITGSTLRSASSPTSWTTRMSTAAVRAWDCWWMGTSIRVASP